MAEHKGSSLEAGRIAQLEDIDIAFHTFLLYKITEDRHWKKGTKCIFAAW